MVLKVICIFLYATSSLATICAMEIPCEKRKEEKQVSYSAPARFSSLPELPSFQEDNPEKNIFLAIEKNNVYLFNASAEKIKDINGSTALYQAIDEGAHDKVLSLLAQGVDPNGLLNERGYTVLGYAKTLGKKNFIDYLVKIRGAIEHPPLIYALKQNSCSDDIIKALVSHEKIMINARSASDNTPLHYAVWLDKQEIACLLCRKGANLLAFNNEKKIPGLYAQNKDFRELLYECSLAYVNKRPISPVLKNAKKLSQSC